MSTSVLREHLREYHQFRFQNEINANPSKGDFSETVVQNEPLQKRKKIIGIKTRRKINEERRNIITMQKKLTTNVEHNINVLKRLAIQTKQNVPQWQERLELIKNATRESGN